jgi:hypothetical protein
MMNLDEKRWTCDQTERTRQKQTMRGHTFVTSSGKRERTQHLRLLLIDMPRGIARVDS